MFRILEGATPYRDRGCRAVPATGWWSGLTLGDYLDRAADIYPDKEASSTSGTG